MAILKPSPSRPSIFSAGTSQSVKINSAVCDPLMPILSSIRPTEKPGKSFSTIKPLMPRVPCSGAVSAKTEVTRAIPPLVIKRFEPLRIYLSPLRTAVVRIAAASEPEPASVSANAAIHSPLAREGKYLRFCSSLPASSIGIEPSCCTANNKPVVAQWRDNSSIAITIASSLEPRPPYSSGKGIARISCWASSSFISQGNSPVWSISAARGATRSRPISCIASINACSSSLIWTTAMEKLLCSRLFMRNLLNISCLNTGVYHMFRPCTAG